MPARNRKLKKVVYTSTAFTIGEARGQIGDETTLHRGYFCTTYEEAKYKAEQVVQQYVEQDLPVVIVNPSGVYGPGGLKSQGEAIVDAINEKLPMVPSAMVGFVYVDDVVQGNLLAAEKGQSGERYILSGTTIDVAELMKTACGLAGVKSPRVGPLFMARIVANVGELMAYATQRPPQLAKDMVAMFAQGLQVDGSKAERELGLSYTPLEEGLSQALEWY